MSSPDTNIYNYTIPDLMTILDLESLDSSEEIIEKTNYYINKFDKEENESMSQFFHDMQDRLISYMENPDEDPDALQTTTWFKNQYLKQDNLTQTNKITQRKNKIEVYNNAEVPMNREQLGVNNNFVVDVAQDTLNPNLENKTTRLINIDSQYRQSTSGIESSATDYTLDLSEPLSNVLSLRLYSLQLPYAWYSIDTYYGNTCFWIDIKNNTGGAIKISIDPGNYTPQQFCTQINLDTVNGFSNTNFTFLQTVTGNYPMSFNPNNGKITMNLFGGTYLGLQMDNTTKVIFFDNTATLNDGTVKNNTSNLINQKLGWLMGYRTPYIYLDSQGNRADSLIDLYGPKYLILAIDDFNQNHINNGLITITELSSNIKLPSYYNPTLPKICTVEKSNIEILDYYSRCVLLEDKINATCKVIPQVLPSAPRTLTQSQIYSINSIIKNNERNTNFRGKAPASSDTFALIPIRHSNSNQTGDLYVEFGGSLQDNKRIYFGPVNIERLRIKLYDDKGNILNMNCVDWSITLIADILYQY
jgi:hypothetical protein